MTKVASSPLAGAEMMTFLAPAAMCLAASAPLVNRPVDSTTTSTPRSPHGSALGSRSLRTRKVLSPARMPSPVIVTSRSSLPSTVSYFSRWASVLVLVKSLTATISMSLDPAATARHKLRPMRPNPLTPTRIVTAAAPELLDCAVYPRSCADPNGTGGRSGRGLRPGLSGGRSGSRSGGRSAVAPAGRLRGQHLRGDAGFGARDADLRSPSVGQREQPAYAPSDRVLGHRGVGQQPEILQADLGVLHPQSAGAEEVLGRVRTEDLHGALHPGPGRDGGAGRAAQVGVVEVRQPVRGGPDLAAHAALLPGQHAVVG